MYQTTLYMCINIFTAQDFPKIIAQGINRKSFKRVERLLILIQCIMKTTISFVLVAFLVLLGCAKSDDVSSVNSNENQLKSARIASIFGVADNTSVLQTSVWAPPPTGGYLYSWFPGYDFTKYDSDNLYDANDYDLMTHFVYISPEAVTGAVVEFTFPHIKYFVPHITGPKQLRIYTANNENNQTDNIVDNPTVITCTTDLVKGPNPMFCSLSCTTTIFYAPGNTSSGCFLVKI